MCDEYLVAIWPEAKVSQIVRELKDCGHVVEDTGLGFVCHCPTRDGLALVFSALRGNGRFRVKANLAFFDIGHPPVIVELH